MVKTETLFSLCCRVWSDLTSSTVNLIHFSVSFKGILHVEVYVEQEIVLLKVRSRPGIVTLGHGSARLFNGPGRLQVTV